MHYLFQVVKTIRGREATTRAKLTNEGWEFVSQTQGTLRTEMTFRRVKPHDPLQRILMGIATGWAAFRRLSPKLQRGLLAGLGAVILLGTGGIVVASVGGDDTQDQSAAPTTASTTSSAEPSVAPATPSTEPSAAGTLSPAKPTVTDTTVDGLVDKINAANMEVGDQFRLTGELVGSRFWAMGASGDFFVTLKTKEGSDLIVFVDKSAAKKWRDGTKVEMVVENVERTISGETSDGWLDAVSVKTIGETTRKAKPGTPGPGVSDALSEYTTTLNTAFGTTVIDGIGPGSADGVFYVNLNLGFTTLSKPEAQTTIRTINSQLVDVAADINSGTPILKYYLAGDVVAENRYIMDPWDVTFEGVLG